MPLLCGETQNYLGLNMGISIVGLVVIANFYLWTTCFVGTKALFPKTRRIVPHLRQD